MFFFRFSFVFFRKPTSPPLTLREGPPLISVFSPQGRRGNRSSSSLVTISFYGWRTIRGLRQQQSCGFLCGDEPAFTQGLGCGLLAHCYLLDAVSMLNACCSYRVLARCLMLAECSLDACLLGAGDCCQGLFGEFLGQHVLEEEGVAEDVTTPHAAGLFQETIEPFETVVLPP